VFQGPPCSQIAVGRTVEAHGVRQGDGRILASRLHVEDDAAPPAPPPQPQPPPPAPPAPPNGEVEFTGAISALSGACPAVQLTIDGTRVVATAATLFNRGPCSTLRIGVIVEVKGTRQSNGS
jgi:hypothetical protein